MNETQDPSNQPRFTIRGQFIKDLSFENPHAPQSLLATDQKPKIEMNVHLKAQKLQDDFYELLLQISAKAVSDKNTLFVVDLVYGGLFYLTNVSEEQRERLLLIDAPFALFPFARRVISDVTRDGGFPPLLMDPIDFGALFFQNKEKLSKAAS